MIEPLPDDILQLLRHRVGSLEELEILLLLHRTRERAWAAFEIARQLGLPDSIAETTLATMKRQGFFATEGITWQYAPNSPELGELIDRLAHIYAERRLEIMRLLSAQALERLRDSAARAFADAFVIGRKKDG